MTCHHLHICAVLQFSTSLSLSLGLVCTDQVERGFSFIPLHVAICLLWQFTIFSLVCTVSAFSSHQSCHKHGYDVVGCIPSAASTDRVYCSKPTIRYHKLEYYSKISGVCSYPIWTDRSWIDRALSVAHLFLLFLTFLFLALKLDDAVTWYFLQNHFFLMLRSWKNTIIPLFMIKPLSMLVPLIVKIFTKFTRFSSR
jgi:hypothetical protein